MTYRGTVRNGVVVFKGARRPTEGTAVEVRPVAGVNGVPKAAGSPKPAKGSKSAAPRVKPGRRGAKSQRESTLERLAREQGVTRAVPFDELLGGWPQGEEQDGFDAAVTRWRGEEPRRGEF